MHDQVMYEISQLPQCKLWLCQPQIQNIMPVSKLKSLKLSNRLHFVIFL